MTGAFASPAGLVRDCAVILRPPRRVLPSTAAHGHLANDRDVLDIESAPYLIEPLDHLAGRLYQGVVFVGPARTGKTFGIVIAGIYYVVTVAPADMLAIYMSQDAARDFSRMELDRAIAHTPELGVAMSTRPRDDNTYDKFFKNGIALKIGWPASTQLRGKTVRYVFLMDYDGSPKPADVDKKGSLWGQAFKRIETYLSRGKCYAESSPGFECEEASWQPRTPHEAPPALGIASLYNSGTRARWYWACLHCRQHSQAVPGIRAFQVPEFDEVKEAVQKHDLTMLAESWAKWACPQCGALHEPQDKVRLNARRMDGTRIAGATWLHEGQRLVDGRVEGDAKSTNIASYWLGGVAAAYQPWISLVRKYLDATLHYVRTGDETDLRQSSHDDQAWPYISVARRGRSTDELTERVEEADKGVVAAEARFLTAAVDVQAHRFVVEVFAWGVGLQSWLVDRFSITASNRPEGDKFAGVDPAAYVEDWMVLVEQVIERKYPVEGLELELGPLLTFVDSGGREGVTDKAYEFWRAMRAKGLGNRVRLIKGVGNINAPRAQEAWPDARARKDRKAGRGDVPVWLLNVNVIKDGVHGDLSRKEIGPGYCHLPSWVDDGFFAELTAEVRKAKGWEREGHAPNEAFDLHCYNRAACIVLQAEAINWEKPPEWAAALKDRAALLEERQQKARTRKVERAPRRNWVKQW